MALDAPIINLKGVLHSGITEFVIPSCDLFLIDLGVAARVGTTGVAPGMGNTQQLLLGNPTFQGKAAEGGKTFPKAQGAFG